MKRLYPIIGLLFVAVGCESGGHLPDPYEAGWNGKKVCTIRSENDAHRLLECTFPPGVGHEKHEHAPHTGYTVTGSTFRIKDESGVREIEVPSGYVFENETSTIHEVQNIGTDTAVFLIYEYK